MAKVIAIVLILSSLGSAFAKDKEFHPPRAFHAKTYPAHETHDNEKLSVAADPYDMPEKTNNVFSVDYRTEGFVPIQLIFSNDNDQPMSLAAMKVTLVTKKREKIDPSRPDDIFRRITKQTRRGDEGQLPFPFPRKKNHPLSAEVREEVQSAQFLARAVEPHNTQAGFVFFDVEGIENPLAGARLLITGIADSKGQELFYFEIPLEKYLNYQPAK